ncbi:MAG: OmpA family protein [Gammaproteobacteria bacterium]
MKHRQFVFSFRAGWAVMLGLALALLLSGTPLSADENVKIFTEPPEARELANILFPPRYRAIVLSSAPQQPAPEQPAEFGLLINFEFDSTTIVPQSLRILDSIGEMMHMKRLANQAIVIEGHTDGFGTDRYNQRLSEQRARAVKRYLSSVYGIDPARLIVEGKGERDLHDQRDPANPVNRRVQFRALNRS